MSSAFAQAWWSEIRNFEEWDAAGIGATTFDDFFKQLAALQRRVAEGALSSFDDLRAYANGYETAYKAWAKANATVAAQFATLSTEERAFLNQARSYETQLRFTVDNLKAAANSQAGLAVASAEVARFAVGAGKSLGAFVGLAQIASEMGGGSLDDVGKVSAGVLAGYGAGLAAAAFAASNPLGWVGAVVAVAASSYIADKSAQALWTRFVSSDSENLRRQLISQAEKTFGANHPFTVSVKDAIHNAADKLGMLDGTWLEGFSSSELVNTDKALLTYLFLSPGGVRYSDSYINDMRKLFDAQFSGVQLPVRDALLIALAEVSAASAAGYDAPRVTDSNGVLSLELGVTGSSTNAALRDAAERLIDEADRDGFATYGATRVVISPTGGTLSGESGADLLIGSRDADGLIGGAGNDELIAGAGADILLGQEGVDILFGGADNDVLDGGTNGDTLYGGAGTDTYRFTAAFGGDTIIDSDGAGVIEVDGVQLTGQDAERAAAGIDVWSDDDWVYTLVANASGGTDLILQRDGSLNQIRVRNWTNGQLGITLGNIVTPPQFANVLTGDIIKAVHENGVNYLFDAFGNYQSAGSQPDAQDQIHGSNSADSISGGGGNDGLFGRAGNDVIDGGAGADVLLGGAGADTLRGGDGNDYIFGSDAGSGFTQPTRTDFVPREALGTEIARGFNWVVYDPPGTNSLGDNVYTIAGVDFIVPNGESDSNLIEAGAGNDRVRAGSSADIVYAGTGDDNIAGMGGSDALYGEEGNDLVLGDGSQPVDGVYYGEYTPLNRHGNDVIAGGAGNDTLVGQGGDDQVYGGDDDDRLWGDDAVPHDVPVTIHGSDYLDGGDGSDQLIGGARADELFGGTGDDSLWGDSASQPTTSQSYLQPADHGADYLDGEAGNDYLQGEGGADTLFGGADSDTLMGDSPTDRLAGSDHGCDYLDGEEGNDNLAGQGGADLLFGGAGIDTLIGDGTGAEVSAEFHGADYLDGEGDNDFLRGDGGADTLYGGMGDDNLVGDNLTSALEGAAHGADYLDGEEGADQLTGSGGTDTLFGGAGADSLYGDGAESEVTAQFHGADYLDGEGDNDQLRGDGGADTLYGGDGDDNLVGDNLTSELAGTAHGADYLDGEEGNDQLTGSGGADLLFGGAGADSLFGDDTGSQVSVQFHGADYLDGGSENDYLQGDGGADTLFGGTGNDTLFGDAQQSQVEAQFHANDLLDGGDGDDVLVGGGRDDVVQGGSGADQLQGDDVTANLDAGAHGADTLDGGAGNDTLFGGGGNDSLAGDDGDDWLAGEDELSSGAVSSMTGNDSLDGGAGADTLIGGNGSDDLRGGDGNDRLYGGNGNDTLRGGVGVDELYGGAGNDTYVLQASDLDSVSADLIIDTEGTNALQIVEGAITSARVGVGNELVLDFGTRSLRVSDGLLGSTISNITAADGTTQSLAAVLRSSLTTSVNLATSTAGASLAGGTAADQLTSYAAGARLEGAGSNDTYTISAEAGGNTIVLKSGDGLDRVNGTAVAGVGGRATNQMEFGAGISADSVRLVWQLVGASRQLVLRYGTGSDGVIVSITRDAAGVFTSPFDRLTFADGSELTLAQVLARGVEVSDPTAVSLTGTALDDVLISNASNNQLSGGLGSDTYRFGRGDGRDSIFETTTPRAGDVDTLEFNPGVAPADVFWFRHSPTGVTGRILGTTDEIRFEVVGAGTIEQVRFADGTVLSLSQLPIASGADQATAGNDTIYGSDAADAFDALAGNDYVQAGGGDDSVRGGAGNDLIEGVAGADQLWGDSGDDSLLGGDGADVLYGDTGADYLFGDTGDDYLDGGSEAGTALAIDRLYGGEGNDTLVGGETMDGGLGHDTYLVAATSSSQTIVEQDDATPSVDTIVLPQGATPANTQVYRGPNSGNGEPDHLLITGSTFTVTVQNFFFEQGTTNKVERIMFPDGTVWTASDVVAAVSARPEPSADERLDGYRWNDTIDGFAGNDLIYGWQGDDLIDGGAGNDLALGADGSDTLRGAAGNDQLDGGFGSDDLDGGAGRDTLFGGRDSDVYRWSVTSGSDVIVESGAATVEQDELLFGPDVSPTNVTLVRDGLDLVFIAGQSTSQLRIGSYFVASGDYRIETVRFADGSVWDAAAISSRLTSVPNAMTGTAGDDTFVVDDPRDTVTEADNQGIDTVLSSVSFRLPTNVENLTLTGFLNATATGNTLANVLRGNASDNALVANSAFGDDGADTLYGGAGDDAYYIDGPSFYNNDTVVEAANEGTDTVFVDAVEYTLPANVENMTITLSAFSVTGASLYFTGNALANVLVNDTGFGVKLDGGAGADTMIGGTNYDTYHVDNAGDVVIERRNPSTPGGGIDTVRTSVSFALPEGVENLEAVGAGVVTLTGNAANNRLDGTATLGPDTLIGGAGDDRYLITAGVDIVVEGIGAGNDTVVLTSTAGGVFSLASYANFENIELAWNGDLVGNASDNGLVGSTSANVLDGGAGNDTISDQAYSAFGYAGDVDTLIGGDGDDSLGSRGGFDVFVGGRGDDTITTAAGVVRFARGDGMDRIVFGTSNVSIELQPGLDAGDLNVGREGRDLLLSLGSGDALRVVDLFNDSVTTAFTWRISGMTFAGGGTLDLDALQRRLASANPNVGTTGDDLLFATAAQPSVAGAAGNDEIWGRAGADSLAGDTGNDVLRGWGGADTLMGGAGDDSLLGGVGSDTYTFALGDGIDSIEDSGDADTLEFAAGIATRDVVLQRSGLALQLQIRGSTDRITITNYFSTGLPGDTGGSGLIEAIRFSDGTSWNVADVLLRQGRIVGTDSADVLVGEANQANNMAGLAGNDRLEGGSLSDTLDGGAGADTMVGGDGWDTYVVDSAADVIQEIGSVSGASDSIESSISYTLPVGFATLTLTGSAVSATGNDLSNGLYGNDLANVLDGRGGADGMSGNGGDDRYIVDDAGDEVYEDPGMGIDTVESSVSFTLLDDVEHLILTGTAAINGTGNAAGNALTGNSAANTLTGNAGNDTLDGGAGNDSLVGGAGDDTYLVDSTTDMVTETSNNGNDIVRSTATFTLGANVEQLVLLGTAAVNATGNSANNTLTGNSAANALNGGSGADTMAGGAGDDSYTVDNAGDVVTELSGEGLDAVNSSVTFTLGANVENLTLTGTTAINGTGNSAANVLIGNSAANVLTGGAGDDTYVVGTGDSVVENAGEGTDAVQSGVTWTLATNVESLVLTGTGAINGTGNAGNNGLTGNSGANRLDGGAGTDSMAGGAGNDTYVVDNIGDTLTELAAGGTDTVESSVTWVLASEFENLTLTGSGAINGTGNALANTLIGNAGANRLDGGAGADSMTGGAGNDTYVVDNTGDRTTEAAGGGSDTIEASVTWTLATEVENLTLTGTSAINGTGNGLANTLRGNAANNALSGGAGNDTMIGGAGDDTYTVDSASDVITELTGEGTDSVNSGVTFTLAANVERLTLTGTTAINGTGNTGDNQLTGNSANNNLSGGAGNDSIDGGTGNDTMVGGAGNDTFVVNIATDVVTELANEGTDTVQSSVTLTLAANVENLTLTGTTAINGTGNTLANVLIGNSAVNTLTGGDGNDTLDGGAGNDSLVGGLGNDTYVVDSASDTINEAASAGTDTVQSSVTLTLTSTNLENLTLLGSAVINGTGNVNANVLTGSGGNNTLAGLEGADTYDGGAGNDTLTDSSTSSSDIYRWGTGQGSDAINDAGGSADRIELAAGIVQSQVSLARSGNHLVVRITGSTDTLTVNNWYAANANKVEEIRLADGSVISLGTAAPLSLAMPSRAWAQIRRPQEELQAGIGLRRAAAAYSPVDGDRAAQSLVQAMAQFGATQAPMLPNAKRWFMDDRRIDLASPL